MKRLQNTGVVEVASTVLETTKFNVAVVEKGAMEKVALQTKLETILKAYNEAKGEAMSRDTIIAKLKSQLGRTIPSR